MPPRRGSIKKLLPTAGAATDARLTAGQNTFAHILAQQTGLNVNVIAAWLLAEESGSAAQRREAEHNHDWLNIGYTDSATLGASNSFWNDPTSAAQATAAWMGGTLSVPGFGYASAGIRRILQTAGQSTDTQIAAIAGSGWASSGYNGGNTLRQLMTGGLAQPAKGAGPVQDLTTAAGGLAGGLASGLLGLSGDIAGQLALVAVAFVKDAALSLDAYVWRPWWHWNQRAVTYYYSHILMPTNTQDAAKHWTALPWTATFWGFGYWLLWTDPDGKGLAPAAPTKSRLARHVRATQAVPARRSLIKPKDVKAKTPKKPTPVTSAAPVRQVGTMATERRETVKVTGHGREQRNTDGEVGSQIPVERAGTIQGAHANGGEVEGRTPRGESHANDRTGTSARSRGNGSARRGAEPGSGSRDQPGRGPATGRDGRR